MSLVLNMGTKPEGLEVKTHGLHSSSALHNVVFIGGYEISIADFFAAAEYVLTNTDLDPNDPRLQFVKCIQSMKEVEGYNKQRKRLEASEPPFTLPPA